MKHHFDPDEIRTMCAAFELALEALEKDVGCIPPKIIRDHVGRAIVRYAQEGHMDKLRLATYAAYRGRDLIDLKSVIRIIE
ncbi:MAG: hypothetical protein NW223_15480 [Hyphomicrobiaceae bacterium]|nr:hypothetical protein [Hyphomicrobiaceae bacterium]